MNKNTRTVAAIILIGVGLMSMMSLNLLWPMFILLPGLVMLGMALWGGRAGATALSIPGMFVSGLGGLLFIQNWTGYWESWAYAWTLLGVFVGMGFMLMGQRLEERSVHRLGRWFVNGSLVAFAGFALIFELIIGISGGGGTLGALIMVGLGLLLLNRDGGLRQSSLGNSAKAKRDEEPLFTGPIVYGSRASARDVDRLILANEALTSQKEANV